MALHWSCANKSQELLIEILFALLREILDRSGMRFCLLLLGSLFGRGRLVFALLVAFRLLRSGLGSQALVYNFQNIFPNLYSPRI